MTKISNKFKQQAKVVIILIISVESIKCCISISIIKSFFYQLKKLRI